MAATHLLRAAGAAFLLGAAPALAQGTISVGETVTGELTASDPTLDDGSHYDLWRFRGTAGQRVVVTLRSDDFDAFLAVGPSAGSGCEECETDDDGAGGTDSRVTLTLPAAGTYEIRANSLGTGETGRYTLSLLESPPLRPRGEVRAGQTVQGELRETSATLDDGSFADLWTVRGRAGERVVVTLRSEDFDAFLGLGHLVDGVWQEVESDDDGAGGTDSRLEATVGDDGRLQLRVGTFLPGETGAYTLSVDRG